MNVKFTTAPDPLSRDAQVKEMSEYQNRLNEEYNKILNGIITVLMGELQDYLDRFHPGLDVPLNGSHFHIVRNSLEELDLLLLERGDLIAKCDRYKKALEETCSTIYSKIYVGIEDESAEEVKENILVNIRYLKYIPNIMDMRLDCVTHHTRMISKFCKVLDMAKKITDGDGDDDVHKSFAVVEDDFLGILRKGVLSINMDYSQHHLSYLEVLGELLELCKEREETMLDTVNDRIELMGTIEVLKRENYEKECRRKGIGITRSGAMEQEGLDPDMERKNQSVQEYISKTC